MDFQYLKDKQHYVDRYDILTIEECLHYYRSVRDGMIKEKNTQFAKYSQKKYEEEINKCLNLLMYSMKGENYRKKAKTIEEWMEEDRKMQELYDNTPIPSNVRCKNCDSLMEYTDKNLHNAFDPEAYMTFMFKCNKCKNRRAVYRDGSEWKYDPQKCPKCRHNLETDVKFKDDISIFTSKCQKCRYKDKHISDHAQFQKEQEDKEKKDKEQLAKYRDMFCLSEKEGKEYIEMSEVFEVAAVVQEEERQKYESPVYERSLKLKKTKISDIETLLMEALEKKQYIKLVLGMPDMHQYLTVPFSIQDSSPKREDRASIKDLEKLIKEALEDTNWRLILNSIVYRLGYLEGMLRGYEGKEEMMRLVGQKEVVKPKMKIDEAKRQKYASHTVVQLAKMFGEHDGIEAMRTRRLEKEPDGFFLNDGKVGYTCGVCRETIAGDNTWWDLKGIRCGDCQRNLKAGVVPLEIFEDDYGYDVVVEDWKMQTYYGIHPATLRKFCRQGLLKSRDLKRLDGTVYRRLFMVSENVEFFKTHHKNKGCR